MRTDDTEERRPDGVPVELGDAVVVPTSGSTGDAKGVVLTHDAGGRRPSPSTARSVSTRPATSKSPACRSPTSTTRAVVMRGLVTGTPVVVHGRFDADAVEAAARAGATHASLVPTALARIDASLFERIVVGGSAPPAERPPNVVASYALTETGSTVAYDGVPLDGVELRIVDGEVQVRGAMLLRCYRDGTDPKTADGWLPTGDAGHLDADGTLHVQGRRGDLIVTGGENTWPVPVEDIAVASWGPGALATVGGRGLRRGPRSATCRCCCRWGTRPATGAT